MPIFSFVIPVYNACAFINECVSSILRQTFADFEIIIIDDGSTDGSSAACDQLALLDSRIKVAHKDNEGVSLSRKRGIDIAEGEYILFVDADDWISDDLLFELAKVIEKEPFDVICFGINVGTKNGYKSVMPAVAPGLYEKEKLSKYVYPFLIQSKNGASFEPSMCTKCFKSSLVKKHVLADSRATIGEDQATVIACIYNSERIFVIDRSFYFYRYNSESATKKKKMFNFDYPYVVNYFIGEELDLATFDFQKQLDRKITHDVFTLIMSLLNTDFSYSKKRSIFKSILSRQYYERAIKNAKFSFLSKAWLMSLILRHRLFFLLYAVRVKYGR